MCFLGGLPFLALSFILTVLCINIMYCVAVKREQFCGGFKMLGTDILLSLCIPSFQGRGDQFHQVVHSAAQNIIRRISISF